MGGSGFLTYGGTSPVTTSNGVNFTIDWAATTSSASTSAITWKKYNANATYTWGDLEEAWYEGVACREFERNRLENNKTYLLPDGAVMAIDGSGNYRIEDKEAKVTYRANRFREFSPHLNASDMLAKFVEYVGGLGIPSQETMKLPLHLFVAWLVIEAASRDGDAIPADITPVDRDPLLKAIRKPRCLFCGRFIRRLHVECKFPYCSLEHGQAGVRRLEARQLSA